MKQVTLAIGLALACLVPVHAQEAAIVVQQPDTVVVHDPDPPTPGIQQTTTTTTVDHKATVTPSPAPRVVHHAAHPRPVHHAATAYHPARAPVKAVESTDTRTTTQTTVTIPPRNPSTVVSEHADGSVTVDTEKPAVVVPADPDDQN